MRTGNLVLAHRRGRCGAAGAARHGGGAPAMWARLPQGAQLAAASSACCRPACTVERAAVHLPCKAATKPISQSRAEQRHGGSAHLLATASSSPAAMTAMASTWMEDGNHGLQVQARPLRGRPQRRAAGGGGGGGDLLSESGCARPPSVNFHIARKLLLTRGCSPSSPAAGPRARPSPAAGPYRSRPRASFNRSRNHHSKDSAGLPGPPATFERLATHLLQRSVFLSYRGSPPHFPLQQFNCHQ